jgi:type II restriction enzyme
LINLHFDESVSSGYKSNSQKIRVMSENWIAENMYCPCCGNSHITNLKNNKPVADFQCDYCGEIFELKSKEGNLGKKITDGAYHTMIERITSTSNPDLFIMQYSMNYDVIGLMLIPKFFFVPDIIEKRKPLAPTARRAGWIGCNILINEIPLQGKIPIIQNRRIYDSTEVIENYSRIKSLQTKNIDSRGWLLDVLNCVNQIPSNDFYLKDVYEFADVLSQKHINNNNIEAKIRQQLQLLRDKGFIEFMERGHYRKLY